MIGSAEARSLHDAHPAIDLHADTLMWSRWIGYDLHARHEPPLWRGALAGHVDIPRMREGGMGAQFFGLVSLPVSKRMRGLARTIHEQIDALEETIARQPDAIRLVRKAHELEEARAAGAVGALLGIEGAHARPGGSARAAAAHRRAPARRHPGPRRGQDPPRQRDARPRRGLSGAARTWRLGRRKMRLLARTTRSVSRQ